MSGLLATFQRLTLVQALGLGLGISALYYFGAFDPGDRLSRQIGSAKESLRTKTDELQKLKAADSERERLAFQVSTLTDEFKSLVQFVPAEFDRESLMRLLVEEVRAVGAKNIRVSGGQSEMPLAQKNFKRFSADVTFETNFADGMKFLSNLSAHPRIIHIDKIEVDSRRSLEPSLYVQTPSLGFRVVVSAFKYVFDDPKKKAGSDGK